MVLLFWTLQRNKEVLAKIALGRHRLMSQVMLQKSHNHKFRGRSENMARAGVPKTIKNGRETSHVDFTFSDFVHIGKAMASHLFVDWVFIDASLMKGTLPHFLGHALGKNVCRAFRLPVVCHQLAQ